MNKNDIELSSLIEEIKLFVKDRESLAAITNTEVLDNASQIFQINKQTRSKTQSQTAHSKTIKAQQNEHTAGYLRNEGRPNTGNLYKE